MLSHRAAVSDVVQMISEHGCGCKGTTVCLFLVPVAYNCLWLVWLLVETWFCFCRIAPRIQCHSANAVGVAVFELGWLGLHDFV